MSELSGSPAAATIAGLVKIMCGIYDYKLSQPPPHTEITMLDAMRYFLAVPTSQAYANRAAP